MVTALDCKAVLRKLVAQRPCQTALPVEVRKPSWAARFLPLHTVQASHVLQSQQPNCTPALAPPSLPKPWLVLTFCPKSSLVAGNWCWDIAMFTVFLHFMLLILMLGWAESHGCPGKKGEGGAIKKQNLIPPSVLYLQGIRGSWWISKNMSCHPPTTSHIEK